MASSGKEKLSQDGAILALLREYTLAKQNSAERAGWRQDNLQEGKARKPGYPSKAGAWPKYVGPATLMKSKRWKRSEDRIATTCVPTSLLSLWS